MNNVIKIGGIEARKAGALDVSERAGLPDVVPDARAKQDRQANDDMLRCHDGHRGVELPTTICASMIAAAMVATIASGSDA